MKKSIRTCSTLMDVTTAGIWQLFSATNWNVSPTYEKMYSCGIPIEAQRTGSLLNYAALRSVGTVKTLEPDMYAKINARFNNVDFVANFSKSGYYNIAKPKPVAWSGIQHIKAGVPEEEIARVADAYEEILNTFGMITEEAFNALPEEERANYPLSNFGIYGYRDGNAFKLSKSLEYTKKLGSALNPINPMQVILEHEEWGHDELRPLIKDMSIIKTTWKTYCLHLLNTSDNPARDEWRKKLITSIQSWKFSEGSVEPSTIDALDILSEIDPSIVLEVAEDEWTKEDYHVGGKLEISGKTCLSLSHYPQQSLEMEAQMCIKYILDNDYYLEIEESPSLRRLVAKFESTDVKTMLTPTQYLIVKYGNDAVRKKNKVDENTEKPYADIITFEDVKEKLYSMTSEEIAKDVEVQTWIKRVRDGNAKWFKESIHSTSSWKRFTIGILKGDLSMKYLGFGPSMESKLARAKAMQAFSQKQEEREQAKKEAMRLAKKLEKERAAEEAVNA